MHFTLGRQLLFLACLYKLVLLRNLLCMHSYVCVCVCVYIYICISISISIYVYIGLPKWHSGKESTCQFRRCKRHGFEPWVRKIPWSQKWQPTPVSLPGKSHGQRSLAGYSSWDCRVRHNWAQTCVYTNTHMYVYRFLRRWVAGLQNIHASDINEWWCHSIIFWIILVPVFQSSVFGSLSPEM